MKINRLQILFLGILLSLGLSGAAMAQIRAGITIRVDQPDSGKIVVVGDSIVVTVQNMLSTPPDSVRVRIVQVALASDTTTSTKSAIDSAGVVTGTGLTAKFSKEATPISGTTQPTFRATFYITLGDPQFLLTTSGRLAVIATVFSSGAGVQFHNLNNKTSTVGANPALGRVGDGRIFGIDGVAFATATSLSFDNTQAGATSEKTLTVTNTGALPLTVGGSTGNPLFTVSPASLSLAANASGTVTVTFAPTAVGPQTGALTLRLDKGTSYTTGTLKVTLSGTGVAAASPALSLSAAALAFDSTTVGATSQRTLTISNTGTAALSVGSITSSNSQFTVSPTQITVTAPVGTATSSQTVTVTFAPTSAGSQTGTLTITHNATGSPSTVALTGVGKAAASPTLSLSATSLKFDSTKVGASSQKTFTVSNPGSAALTVSGITVGGADASQVTVSPTTFTVNAGGTAQTVTVTFAPTSGGAKSASLSIAHNATGSPASVALSGVGVAPPPLSDVWKAVNTGLTNTDVGDLAVDPKTPQTVYAGTLGGVFKTTNGGTAWTAVNAGLTNTSVEALAIDPSNPQTVYAGTGGGVFKTTNGGTAWALANSGLLGSVTALVIDPVNSQTLYAAVGGTSSNVYKTTNGGTSWTAAATGLKSNITAFALTVDPKTPQTLYAGVRGNGVYKTTDGGTSWTAVNSGIPDGTTTYGIAVDPSNPQTVYAGTAVGMFKTTSGGTSWTAVNTGLTNTGILSVAIAPSSPPTLYAGTDEGGVFRSTDGAATWAAFNAGLPDQTTVYAFAVDPSNSQTVYAGTGTGVYKSSYSAPTQPPPTSAVPDPAKQDSTKLGVWLDLNTGSGNQMVASASTGPGVEITIQVFGRNLTSATSFGFTLAYDPAVLTFVTDPTRSKAGDYLGSSGIALSPLVSTTGGTTVVTYGVALLGGSPVSGNGFLGTAVFKVSDKFTDGYTEIKVSELKLGGRAQTLQTSNAIVKALKNSPPVAKFTLKPDAIKAGDTKGLVTLDASGSSDPDKDPITLKWSVPGGTFKKATSDTNRVAQVQFSGGATSNVEITLTVTDKNGAKSTLTQTLKVIAPPSATASVAVDLDAAADNQNVGLLYNVKPGDPITLQVFVKDVSGVTGYTVKVNYDSARIGTPAYANGSLVAPTAATFIPLTQAAGGAITGGGSTLPATGSSGSGLLATFTFKASANFEGSATLSVTSVTLRMGATIKELVTGSLDAQVTGDNVGKAGPVSDFGGDGVVDFEDFFSFASQFGLKKGDKGFNALFDLNNNGEVDFEDFFAFAGEFGAKE